jgi:hypothetical protein
MSMFWAGALMAFTPIAFAGIVIGVWWFQRRKAAHGRGKGPQITQKSTDKR